MRSWQEFQEIAPLLERIEQRFTRLEHFKEKYPASEAHIHGFSEDDVQLAYDALMESIKSDAESIPYKIYYWLYPFYSGNFLKLVAALGRVGVMSKQKDDFESRTAFYQFFRTVPLDERLQLGEKLNHPELTQQAIRIQKKIKAKRDRLRDHLNQNHAN